ncbi:MAG: TetR/AcrR family transcriptional regulator [Bullifex sp.]
MPKTYSEEERKNIRAMLIEEAEKALFHGGVESISVDELVKRAAIPKGTFYLFFKSKEELFLSVFSSFRAEMNERILSMLQELDENHIVTSLTDVFMFLTWEIYRRGIFRILDEHEEALIRKKTGLTVLSDEMNRLFGFLREVFSYFAIDDENDLEGFFTSYMLILYSLLHADKIKDLRLALRLSIRGLILQLVGE